MSQFAVVAFFSVWVYALQIVENWILWLMHVNTCSNTHTSIHGSFPFFFFAFALPLFAFWIECSLFFANKCHHKSGENGWVTRLLDDCIEYCMQWTGGHVLKHKSNAIGSFTLDGGYRSTSNRCLLLCLWREKNVIQQAHLSSTY